MRTLALFCLIASLSARLPAQTFTTAPCSVDEGHKSTSWFGGSQERGCELRRATLPLMDGTLQVSGDNGNIEVTGEDRSDIALEARVTTHGASHDDAVALLHRIDINPHSGDIHATGPRVIGWSSSGWSVDYRLRVPRHLAAHLRTVNGGIDLTDVDGNISVGTTNGGLKLRNLAGDVHANTVNGSVAIAMAGRQWHGNGLNAETVNGAISMKAPEAYSAHLVVNTVNGGIAVNPPPAVEGSIRNHLETNLGGGGATLQLKTVNGGVAVSRE